MCTARDGKFAGKKICVEKKFQCDNYLQCEDGKDEEDCEEEYKKKGIFKRDQRIICRSPFLRISNEKNETGKFFPMRAIRFIILILIIIIIIDHDVFRCDMIPQCPHGEDEEGCHIPESARLVMSLFFLIIFAIFIVFFIIVPHLFQYSRRGGDLDHPHHVVNSYPHLHLR